MRRPRRIFGGALLGGGGLARLSARVLLAGLLVLGVGGVVGLAGLPPDLFGRMPALSGTISAAPQDVAVVDGDTLRLNQTVVRLLGVQAPPRGLACRDARGGATDCGREAANALGHLLYGKGVACRLVGRDPRGLPQAACDVGGRALSRAIVAAGWARARDDSDAALQEEEGRARAARRGVWHGGATPAF